MITDKSEMLNGKCKGDYQEKSPEPYTWAQLADKIIWSYAFYVLVTHTVFIIAVFSYIFGLHSVPTKWASVIFAFAVGYSGGLGTTAGAHRLWTHRSYKAKLPLRILLMIFYSSMGMNPLYYWIRDHRVHHKYSETDADPHNASRGFLFSHIGWSVMKRNPECLRRGREIDMSDIESDPVVMFQKKYAAELVVLFCIVIPIAIPIIFWEEAITHAILGVFLLRYVIALNFVFSVNSVAHIWGSRPYNRTISPAENILVSMATFGEGSHNYHHTFPWDYKASEFPYINFNPTTFFIDVMAKIGWAYDLREPSPKLVEKIICRVGYKSEITEQY